MGGYCLNQTTSRLRRRPWLDIIFNGSVGFRYRGSLLELQGQGV
jgi:hypothetical protein